MTLTASPSAASERLGRDWVKLWTADAVSTLGDGAYLGAIGLLAVSFTSSPRLVAGVATASTLPWLLFSLHAGAIADRYDRRRLMWTAQLVQALAVVGVALAAVLPGGRIWMLYIASFALGSAQTIFGNAAQSVLPQIVLPSQLEKANGRQYAVETITDGFVGPPIGSLLFAASAALPFGSTPRRSQRRH
jgi:MFS family permease